MKGVVAAFVLVLLVGLGVWLLFMQPPVQEANKPVASKETTDNSAKDIDASSDLGSTQLSNQQSKLFEADKPALNDELRAEQLAQAKAKLDDLILEYNENLTNPESREETQAQINILLKQYNELVLPVALAKIHEN